MEEAQKLATTKGENIDPETAVYVCLDLIPDRGCIIKTSHKRILEALDDMKKDNVGARCVFKGTLRSMLAYSPEEFEEIYRLQDERWNNYCDDVVLYVCARFVLFNKLIPVCAKPPDMM